MTRATALVHLSSTLAVARRFRQWPTCPRCVAERRAQATAFVEVPLTLLTMYVGGMAVGSLALGALLRLDGHLDTFFLARGISLLPRSTVLVAATACLSALSRHFRDRTATPLVTPPPDPLAHYREGLPLACPRHPWRTTGDPPADLSGSSSGHEAEQGEPPTPVRERAVRMVSSVVVAMPTVLAVAGMVLACSVLLVVWAPVVGTFIEALLCRFAAVVSPSS